MNLECTNQKNHLNTHDGERKNLGKENIPVPQMPSKGGKPNKVIAEFHKNKDITK